ncbi:MAG TPA: hypothetical protein EYP82_04710 [Hydrogenothermaceae bacterium]|nr:hypothetical protein [Hydrogenothermaceae bacterium]
MLFISSLSYGEYQLKIDISSSIDMSQKLKILKDIGIEDCKIYEHEIKCAKTKDINEALRIRNYLERHNIIAFIEEVSAYKEDEIITKNEEKKCKKT